MRLITLCLVSLLLLIQYPLWFGQGGYFRVRELQGQVEQAHQKNAELTARNQKLASEVEDLQKGKDAVEERARLEMRMIKNDEIFVQVLEPNSTIVIESAEDRAARVAKELADARKAEELRKARLRAANNTP